MKTPWFSIGPVLIRVLVGQNVRYFLGFLCLLWDLGKGRQDSLIVFGFRWGIFELHYQFIAYHHDR